MRRIILLTLLGLVSLLFVTTYFPIAEQYKIKQTDISERQVRKIYGTLLLNLGEYNHPPLHVLKNEQINAWTDGKSISITTGLLKELSNEDEIALVLGHELAHYINKDVQRSDGEVKPNDIEAHADKLGGFLMMRSGYDICKGRSTFSMFKRIFGDTSSPEGHPSHAYRYDQLNINCGGVFIR